MRAKSLDESQVKQVVDKAREIVQQHDGDFIKSGPLLDELKKSLPEFNDYSLWKAVDYAVDNGILERVKYKGYRIGKDTGGTAVSGGTVSPYPLPKKDDGKESYYYPFVANWFLKRGDCIAEFKKGREWGMPDISIVRTLASSVVDEIELITVEVKRGWVNLSCVTQAYGYSKLAHRCYLASDVLSDLKKFKENAERVGIGLLHIEPSNPEHIEELLSPPRSEPSHASLYEHLDRVFNLERCCFCGVWFTAVGRDKKEGVEGTKFIRRKRAIPAMPEILLSVCGGCEGLLRLLKSEDVGKWK
jgi:hypothetical protein